MKQVADEDMVRNALGDEGFDELAQPPETEADRDHPLWKPIEAGLRDIYDPEIPVNIYELGLIYKVAITDRADGKADVFVEMTLTSPGCPVAQEMPGWVQGAILPLEGVGDVDVEIIWDPTWTPAMMAETAKLQLNMFT
jgi:FeS assembly SUF system protein